MNGEAPGLGLVGACRPAPVLALHGFEDSSESWAPFIDRSGPMVVAPDLPWSTTAGQEFVEFGPPEESIGRLVDSLAEISMIIAHSFGAGALLLALNAGRVSLPSDLPLVLLCPLYLPPGESDKVDLRDAFRESLRTALAQRVLEGSPRLTHQGSTVDAMVAFVLKRMGAVGFDALYDGYLRTATVDLELIENPVLIVAGGCDPTFPVARARLLQERLPRSLLLVGQDLGHFPHLSRPGLVARAAEIWATRNRMMIGA